MDESFKPMNALNINVTTCNMIFSMKSKESYEPNVNVNIWIKEENVK